MSSALNQNSNGMSAAGMASPVYVSEPPLSPPSPRASAQAPAPPPPPQQPERPVLEVAPDPAPAADAPPAPAPPEPEAPAGLPLEGLLLRFGLITTEQLTEAMRERSATGKPVLRWAPEGDGVRIFAASGQYRAGRLLLTAGGWLPSLLPGLNLPFTVERQVLYWFAPNSAPDGVPVTSPRTITLSPATSISYI